MKFELIVTNFEHKYVYSRQTPRNKVFSY